MAAEGSFDSLGFKVFGSSMVRVIQGCFDVGTAASRTR